MFQAKRQSLFVVVVALVLGVPTHGRTSIGDDVAAREYLVLSAYLRHCEANSSLSKPRSVVIAELHSEQNDDTATFSTPDLHSQCPTVPSDLTVALDAALAQVGTLRPSQFTSVDPEIITREQLTAVKRNGWDGFRKRYPRSDSYFVVSHVAFDISGTWAAFHATHLCPGLCSTEGYVIMRFSDGAWHYHCKAVLWQS